MGARSAPGSASAAIAIVLAVLAISSVSCAAKSEPESAAAGPDAVYQVRGEIARLPDPGSPEIWIRHETIPEFRNASGEVVGMDSMTMPFGVASETALDHLAVGDRIAFRLEIDWDAPGSASRVLDLRPLEPGTRLGFDAPDEVEPGTRIQGAEAESAAEGATPR